MDPLWLLLLLPVAAGSGWVAAQPGVLPWRKTDSFDLPTAYFKGLNFLLNEQHDKAIEVFIKMLEVDSETVEMHLALGNLFRRRGEVERATRIHQNLIARPNLDRQQHAQALFELGQDYLKAGLLDRAESLFSELADVQHHSEQALRHLLLIYEQEKEWEKCAAVARRLASGANSEMSAVIAQYSCELAESALAEGRYDRARNYINSAFAADRNCVRATIQSGRLEALLGQHPKAIATWKRVQEQDPRFLGEVIDLISGSYRITDDNQGLQQFLNETSETHRDVRLALAVADTIESESGAKQAEDFIVNWVRRHPSVHGLHRLIRLKLKQADSGMRRDLDLLDNMIGGIVEREYRYECRQCGFSGRSMHWQCPGCRGWNTIMPMTLRVSVDAELLPD